MTILQRLSQWQKTQAQKEGVDGYMVLPYGALKSVADALPRSEQELLDIKGVGPAKIRKYGKEILEICAGAAPAMSSAPRISQDPLFTDADDVNALLDSHGGDVEEVALSYDSAAGKGSVPAHIDPRTGEILSDDDPSTLSSTSPDALGVSEFLGQINHILSSYLRGIRVRGEIIGFKRNQNGHAYFEMKDADAIVRCSIFRGAYELSGVELSDGVEVIVTGTPSHHERYGFSFIGEFVELAGEGALKKAYDALKVKLQLEGLTSISRKRDIPALPERVGLITSPTGAALGDFTTNVGTYGYKILFHPSSVEGQKAVQELLRSIKKLATMDLDVLVITRGGGSLESLQAFNNENVVRALAAFPVPVIAGIGHEQDETLCTLVADVGVSTPTAAARAVRSGWDDVLGAIERYEHTIIGSYEKALGERRSVLHGSALNMQHHFSSLLDRCRRIFLDFDHHVASLDDGIRRMDEQIGFYEKILAQYHPERQLQLGYSIVRNEKGQVVRSRKKLHSGDTVDVQFTDGNVDAIIK